MIEVDGAHGEGGGQLLRMAVAVAALRGVPVRIIRIRAGRPKPGLAAQHLTAIRALAALSAAEVEGLDIGSKEIVFRPGTIAGGRHTFDVGTAGSVTLVLQACLPVAFAAPAAVTLKLLGGTDVRWSPPLDYVAKVVLPILRRLGGDAQVVLMRRGYYPRGGGAIEVTIRPSASWAPIRQTEPGPLLGIRGVVHVSHLPEDIPKRIKHAAMRRLLGHGEVAIEERVYSGDDAIGQGGALVLWAEAEGSILGADSLAERGKSSERVGQEAADALLSEIKAGATIDIHAGDQLLLYAALAKAPSEFRVREVTEHARTMMWLLQLFLGTHFETHPQGPASRVVVIPADAPPSRR